MATFSNVLQIDTLQDLIDFEEKILEDNCNPLSGEFMISDFDKETGEELYIEDKDNPFNHGTYFIWYDNSFDRLGDMKMRVIYKIPEDIKNIKEINSKLHLLIEKDCHVREKFGKVLESMRNKQTKEQIDLLMDHLEVTDKDFDNIEITKEELAKMGYFYF